MSVPHLCHDYVDRGFTWPTQGQATSSNGMNAQSYVLSVRKLSFMLSMFRAIVADLCHLGESQPAALLLVTRTFVGSCRKVETLRVRFYQGPSDLGAWKHAATRAA